MQQPKQDTDSFLMTSAAARELGLSAQMVIQLERNGCLKAIKTENGTRLFRRSDIEHYKAVRAVRSK